MKRGLVGLVCFNLAAQYDKRKGCEIYELTNYQRFLSLFNVHRRYTYLIC